MALPVDLQDFDPSARCPFQELAVRVFTIGELFPGLSINSIGGHDPEDKTVHFWRDLLGMRMLVGLGHPGYRHYFFEISDKDMIAFFVGQGQSRGAGISIY